MSLAFNWTTRSGRSKKLILITAIMLISIVAITLFLTLASGVPVPSGPCDYCTTHKGPHMHPDEELRMVHMVLRHGARTIVDTYPKDPHYNHTFYPYGRGQLTNEGKKTLFEIGLWARKRYGKLLGDTYQDSAIHAQSTGVTRTQMSIALVLAGLWEPKGTTLEWNKKLNWLPIPYSYEELEKDTLLLVRTSCPRYSEELANVLKSGEILEIIERSQTLFEELHNITGNNFKTPDDIQDLYSTLKAEHEFGLVLPEFIRDYFPHRLQELTDLSYIVNVYNDELKKIKGGPFLKKTLNEWKLRAANNTDVKKMYLYVGHDATVVNVMSAFNVWAPQFPDYATTGVFELYQNKKTGVWGVQILLNKNDAGTQLLNIPGCENPCPLDKLETLLANHIPGDMAEECKPLQEGFTDAPNRGP
ncbi:venom acid phosphatase Acph-1-like isoform X2 [Culicoides brevitarsis]|uniref:venom acid phosphatase Acph-1-like isoform X2 n=1 Tax=Culicoides brevitarsis TaxID=469753 RepID=UPI00307C4BDB